MKGIITSYRRGRHTQNPRQIIVKIDGVDSREEAKKYIGWIVIWRTPSGKEIKGVITNVHGAKGKVRVRAIEKSFPGQAIGTEVEIAPPENQAS